MEQPGRLVISLDFELFWGLRGHRRLEDCREELLGVRRAIPALLELFSEFDVRATWAAVGFLFCQSKDELLENLPRRLPAYHRLEVSPYAHIAKIGDSEVDDPYHFAPSLIDEIAGVPGQEVASHTFSQYYCMEEGQDGSDFEADLQAAVQVARRRDLMLRSLVFPGNQVRRDYLKICQRRGISAYRGNPKTWLYEPCAGDEESLTRRLIQKVDGVLPLTGYRCVAEAAPLARKPVNVPASRYLRPLAGRYPTLARLQKMRLFGELDYAARTGGLYHLWFHPRNFGLRLSEQLQELRDLLERFDGWRRLGYMESVTMHEVVVGRRDAGPGDAFPADRDSMTGLHG